MSDKKKTYKGTRESSSSKKTDKDVKDKPKTTDTVEEYRSEYSNWLKELEPYHERFNTNYEQYTSQNQIKGTEAKVTDPVAPELTERVIQKLFEREPKFFIESRGNKIPSEVKNVLTAVADFAWNNQDTVQVTGTMRSKLKVGGREFVITGNMATEVYWNPTSDTPDMRIVPIEDVIFNPTKNLKTSNRYYVRQFVDLDYLDDNVEVYEADKVVTGIFKKEAIEELQGIYGEGFQVDPNGYRINRNGGKTQNVDKIPLISRYEGKKCCRFVLAGTDNTGKGKTKGESKQKAVIVQEYDNEVLDTNPLQFAMDKELPKVPYAYSVLDDLSGLIKAKNLFVNQMVDYGAKVLNPATIVDPNIGAQNLRTVANMYKLGGIVLAPQGSITHQTMPQLGSFGLEMVNWIEGRAEAVSGIAGWSSGAADPATSGAGQKTKAEVEIRAQIGSSPIVDRQQNIEESIIEPMVNKWIKMIGATMTDDEFKWVMISGENQDWIKATKGFIEGKIKLIDLMQAGIAESHEIQEIVNDMLAKGQDPNKHIMFDIDWIVRVETGSLAEVDTDKEVQNKKMVVELGTQLGVPIDNEKIWRDIAMDAGVKEPGQYILDENQIAEKQQEAQQQQIDEQQISQGIPPQGLPQGQPQGVPGLPEQLPQPNQPLPIPALPVR